MRGIQKFSPEYLEQTRKASPESTLRFLDEFRRLHAPKTKSRLISVKVPEPLLAAFRQRCEIEGVRYQTQIKKLMTDWVETSG